MDKAKLEGSVKSLSFLAKLEISQLYASRLGIYLVGSSTWLVSWCGVVVLLRCAAGCDAPWLLRVKGLTKLVVSWNFTYFQFWRLEMYFIFVVVLLPTSPAFQYVHTTVEVLVEVPT